MNVVNGTVAESSDDCLGSAERTRTDFYISNFSHLIFLSDFKRAAIHVNPNLALSTA